MEPRTANEAATRSDLDAFVDLIVADPDFLTFEFESIVTGSWSEPPDSTVRCAVGAHEPRRPRRWLLGHVMARVFVGIVAPRLGRSRQRSPPRLRHMVTGGLFRTIAQLRDRPPPWPDQPRRQVRPV